ncbi:helix-turn-helix domain-containing protein [Clostridium sp. YIM B02551]|uniref:helix-turn-helix domain-containing protein n=1 Tax=Clostridium sp. YIM B02551 TaxID=2910679 RepID=UPI001EEAD946|nr:helix-turn-helix domain-containing protein [Clostridium sp. YIM B02551]
MNLEIVTPGMKLKELREKLGIKQHELAGNQITRNLISMMENDKASITEPTAKILSENINHICKNKKIDFNVLPDFFEDTVEKQLELVFQEFILKITNEESDFIKENYEQYILKMEDLLIRFNDKFKKYSLYKLLGDKYYESNDYEAAYTYYIKAYENSYSLLSKEEYCRLLLTLSNCCIRLKRYDESIYNNNLAIANKDSISKELAYNIMFNSLLSYKNMNNREKVLSELSVLEKNFSDEINKSIKRKFECMTIHGNCLRELNKFNEAIKKYKQLLDLLDLNALEFQMVTLCNLLETYININDRKNIKMYLNKSLGLMKRYEELSHRPYSEYIYYDIGIAARRAGDDDIAIKYLDKGIKYSRVSKNDQILLNSFEELLEVYINMEITEEIDELKNQFLEVMSLDLLNLECILTLKFIKYYNSIKDFDTINQITEFVLSLKTR